MAASHKDDISTGNSSCEEMRVSDVDVYRREAFLWLLRNQSSRSISFSLSRFEKEH